MPWGQIPLAVVLGDRAATTCRVLMVSLTDDVMTLNGVPQVPVAVGTDHPTLPAACYAAAFTVQASGRTSYTATQNGNVVSGVIPPAKSAGEQVTELFCGCDDSTILTSFSNTYAYARHLALSGVELTAINKLDDPVYPDRNIVDDSLYTGHKSTGFDVGDAADDTLLEYDYALIYAANLGLLGDPTQPGIHHGHDPDRHWAMQNIPHRFMHGDHIWTNNPGWTNVATETMQWTPGVNVWNKLLGAIMPPRYSGLAIDDYSQAMHWVVESGDMQILCMDRITRANGSTGNTITFGDPQIDDILEAAAASSAPFKVLCMPHTIRYLTAIASDLTSGANEPLWNHRLDEYTRLMTAATTGMQALAAANGWTFVVVTFDHHNAQVLQHENATMPVTESFNSVTVGTGFGGQNHGLDPGIETGLVYDGTTMLMGLPYTNGDHIATWLKIESLGIVSPKRLRLTQLRETHDVLWQGEYSEGQSGNLAGSVKKLNAIGSN